MLEIQYDPADSTALTEQISGEDYMEVLVARQAAYMAARKQSGPLRRFPPLLEWFVRAEDEPYVVLPETKPAAKRTPKPRVYRSAASIRAELEKVSAERDAIGASDSTDPASVNISPFAKSKSAARAGRRRFEKMDRDLEKYTQLTQQINQLSSRLALAEARENRSEVP